jgi:hypothetical protein
MFIEALMQRTKYEQTYGVEFGYSFVPLFVCLSKLWRTYAGLKV